jgi:hypothetical protein
MKMKVNEIINIRNVYKEFYRDDLSDDLAVKIKTFLDETEYIEVEYASKELDLLKVYGELDEEGRLAINEDERGRFFKLKMETKDEFYQKITDILLSPSDFHLDESMKLTNAEIDELTDKEEAKMVLEVMRQ